MPNIPRNVIIDALATMAFAAGYLDGMCREVPNMDTAKKTRDDLLVRIEELKSYLQLCVPNNPEDN